MRYAIIFFVLALLSCNKNFLEPKDSSSLNRQTYVTDLSSMEKFANGIQQMIDRDFLRDFAVAYGDLTADNIKPADMTNAASLLQYTWSQKASESTDNWVTRTSTAMNGEWKSGYLDIRACNFVIEEIGKYRNENPAKADKLKGQAYAIRAMVHFKLVNFFAQTFSYTPNAGHTGIPYITTSDITAPYHRSSVAEVYDNIISDLKEAIRLIPENVIDPKMMGKLSAKALLARAYLFTGDYENAKKTALEVTAACPMMTIEQGYPEKMYTDLPPGSAEVLYQFSPAFRFDPVTIVTSFPGIAYGGFTVSFLPTRDIIETIRENPNDKRNNWLADDGSGVLVVAKYPQGLAGIHFNPAGDYYQPALRSSEMFLTVAEAAMQTNDETMARQYLNAVRKRADPNIPDISPVGAALKDSIYKERRKELAFEGFRMFDLQRWHKDVQRNDVPQGTEATRLPYPSNKAISPIPLQDVRIAGLGQNPDY